MKRQVMWRGVALKMDMRTQGLFIAAIMLLVLTGCSKETEEWESAIGEDPKDYSMPSSNSVSAPEMECDFRGVWTMDDVKADTIDVSVRTGVKIPGYGVVNRVAFFGFPYQAMTKKILPEVNIAKITTGWMDGGPLPADEAMLVDAIVAHGDGYNCMENYVSEEYRCIGLSENAIYLELKPGRDYAVQYLPWVVTTAQGDMFPMVATVVPDKSTATLNTNGQTFSSTLTVSHVEYKVNSETVIKELEPEMKLKYTSIERVERASLGN